VSGRKPYFSQVGINKFPPVNFPVIAMVCSGWVVLAGHPSLVTASREGGEQYGDVVYVAATSGRLFGVVVDQ